MIDASQHRARTSGEPAEATTRKISMLLGLLRSRRLSIKRVMSEFNVSERQVLRDLQELRKLGTTLGFKITSRNTRGEVELAEFAARPASLMSSERNLRTLIVELFKAFGEPLAPFAAGIDESQTGSPFVRVIMPHLVDGSEVAKVLKDLREAWEANARVRFRYKGKEREVEPSVAVVRSGRYYLIGAQTGVAKNPWRIFSMDEIEGPIRRSGTFTPKRPPADYASTDTIGWIKGEKNKIRVEVTLTPLLAAAASSRVWQEAQETVYHDDGSATLRFTVNDIDEVIRWALGFGESAWISAPPEAVARAREMVGNIANRYSLRHTSDKEAY